MYINFDNESRHIALWNEIIYQGLSGMWGSPKYSAVLVQPKGQYFMWQTTGNELRLLLTKRERQLKYRASFQASAAK